MISLRVNTRTGSVTREKLKPEYRNFGSRGLVARAALDEIPPECDPLGPDNKILIAQGLLAGTIVTTSGRMSIGGKSPLTGGIKEANVGGMVGKALVSHGIKLLIVEGVPAHEERYILLVRSSGEAELIERSDLAEINIYPLVDKLRGEYGQDAELLVCGPAGESLFKTACLMTTDYATGEPCRVAGRGGLGAVMGARRLKAIVVQKAEKPFKAAADAPMEFKSAAVAFHKLAAANSTIAARSTYGTFGGNRKAEATGVLPVKNFRSFHFGAIEKIDAQAIVDKLDKNGGKYGLACQAGCLIRCSNYYVDDNGRHTTSGFNYETLGLCGSNLMLDSLDEIAEIKHLCDDFGVDSIEMGAALGLFMEAGNIPWGDGQVAISLLKEIIAGRMYASEAAQGLNALGEALGVSRVPAVRGQAFPAYDVRNDKGMGLTFLAGTMGADHTLGSAVPEAEGDFVKNSAVMMNLMAAIDNMVCMFLMQPLNMDRELMAIFLKALSAFFGETWDLKKLLDVGKETIMNEYRFNEAARVGPAVMPKMFTEEKSVVSGERYDVDPVLVEALQAIYKVAA